jgi:hypothetical protein
MDLAKVRHVRMLSGEISVPDVLPSMDVSLNSNSFDQQDAVSHRFGEAVGGRRRHGKYRPIQARSVSQRRVHGDIRRSEQPGGAPALQGCA